MKTKRKLSKSNWYMSRSRITTNKKEAQRIANTLKAKGRFKDIKVMKRNFASIKKTKTPAIKGFWVKVKK